MLKYLAIDIGAGSGRIIEGCKKKGKIELNEVYRFENKMKWIDGHYRWDIKTLFAQIVEGLQSLNHKDFYSIAIDTWGVDFALIDTQGQLLELPIAYRDSYTDGLMEEYANIQSLEDHFKETGLKGASYNTIYQLLALQKSRSLALEKANSLLFIPDYLNYLLTGKKYNEVSIASTSGMLKRNRCWSSTILNNLNISEDLFSPLIQSGHLIGPLREELQDKFFLPKLQVYSVASHDTASAVAAIPAKGHNWAFISSGTWCIMGIESDKPLVDKKIFDNHLSNEAGVANKNILLKNIMGLWIIRKIKESLKEEYSFSQLIDLAEEARSFSCIIDVNDQRFSNPSNMCEAIDSFCIETKQEPPKTPGAYIRCAEEGLALAFKETLGELELSSLKKVNRLHILGGGVKDRLLCQFTANATKLKISAGPIEGTSTGNILTQMVANGEISSYEEGRLLVKESFDIKEFEPCEEDKWAKNYKKYIRIKEELYGTK